MSTIINVSVRNTTSSTLNTFFGPVSGNATSTFSCNDDTFQRSALTSLEVDRKAGKLIWYTDVAMNVKWWGAVGNGVADDTVAIQAALLTFSNLNSWLPITAYTVGEVAVNNGRAYLVTAPGTSAGTGGPTGTSSSVVDGSVTWRFLGAGATIGGISGSLYFPSGLYKLTDTVFYWGSFSQAVNFYGDGQADGLGSTFIWGGSTVKPMWHSIGANFCIWEKLCFGQNIGGIASNIVRPQYGLWMDYRIGTTGTQYPTDGCVFRDCMFQTYDISTQIGGAGLAFGNSDFPDRQADNMSIECCDFTGGNPVNTANTLLWKPSTSYAFAADTVWNNGYVFVCSTPGTSAGSGPGPVGVAYQNNITDGSVVWSCLGTSLTQNWQPNTSYTVYSQTPEIDQYVVNGGNIYQCQQNGTSAGSGGPTGAGTFIVDGTTAWRYVGNTSVGNPFRGSGVRLLTTANTKNYWVSRCNFNNMRIGYDAVGATASGIQKVDDSAFGNIFICIRSGNNLKITNCELENGGYRSEVNCDCIFTWAPNGSNGPLNVTLINNELTCDCPDGSTIYQDTMCVLSGSQVTLINNYLLNSRSSSVFEPIVMVGATIGNAGGVFSSGNDFANSENSGFAPFYDSNKNHLLVDQYGRNTGSYSIFSWADKGYNPNTGHSSSLTDYLGHSLLIGSLSYSQNDIPDPNGLLLYSGITRRTSHDVDFSYQTFVDAPDQEIVPLKSQCRLVGVVAEIITPFAGTAISAITISVGIENDQQCFLINFDATSSSGTVFGNATSDLGRFLQSSTTSQSGYSPSWSATTGIRAFITTTGNNFTHLTAGKIRFHIITEMLGVLSFGGTAT